MIKYNNSNINDWYYNSSDIIKVYRNNAVCYYKITSSGDTPTIPSGYTEVEYIQNTGTSYINTNIQLCSATTNTFQVVAKIIASRIGGDTYQNIFSCMSEAGEPYQGFAYRFVLSNINPSFIPSNDGSFTQVSNEDGTTSVTASSTNGLTYSHTYPLTICAGLDSNRNPFRYTNTKVYSFKVTLNNELVGDYVPVIRDSDSKYGLYDLVTESFFISPNGSNFSGSTPPTPPQTLQWVTFNVGDTIPSTLEIYGVSGVAVDISTSLAYNSDCSFVLDRNYVDIAIMCSNNNCYADNVLRTSTIEIIFSQVGCCDSYKFGGTVIGNPIQLYIYA